MNICMCGYQPGAASHAVDCPYPLFRGTATQEDAWMAAFHAAREERMIDEAQDPAAESDVAIYGAGCV